MGIFLALHDVYGLPHVPRNVYEAQWLSHRPGWYPLLCTCLSCLQAATSTILYIHIQLGPIRVALESNLDPLELQTVKKPLPHKPAKLHRISVHDESQATMSIKSSSPHLSSFSFTDCHEC